MSAEEAQAALQNLTAQHTVLLSRMSGLENEHQRVHGELAKYHAELDESKSRVAALESRPTTGGGSFAFRLIDPKTMVPEKLSGRSQWRGWSEATRSYVENLDTRLAEHVLVVEGKEEPLTIAELASAGVSEENSRQMSRYLKLRTEGGSHAAAIVKAAQEKMCHPLEQ